MVLAEATVHEIGGGVDVGSLIPVAKFPVIFPMCRSKGSKPDFDRLPSANFPVFSRETGKLVRENSSLATAPSATQSVVLP